MHVLLVCEHLPRCCLVESSARRVEVAKRHDRARGVDAVAWEVGMWVAVLAPGHRPRVLAVCVAFLFHQSNIWMMRIFFDEFQAQ